MTQLEKARKLANRYSEDMVVKVLDDGCVKLVRPFYFYSSKDENDVVIVPANFISDFASVPAFLRCFISPIGKHSKAAVLHDYLCEKREFKRADAWFLDALNVAKVGFFSKWAMYLSVRIYHIVRYGE